MGFYQLSKICITPAVLALNSVVSKELPTPKEVVSVVILCVGVALATISEGDMSTNIAGISVAVAAITFTAIYQACVSHSCRLQCAQIAQSPTSTTFVMQHVDLRSSHQFKGKTMLSK